MNDLISRQEAIAVVEGCGEYILPNGIFRSDVLYALKKLPSAQPERKKGKWERITNDDNGVDFRCSACHKYRFHNGEMRKKYKFCPNCGADMRG